VIWGFVGIPSLRQAYTGTFVSDPTCKRIGTQTFLVWLKLVTDLLIIVKFSEGEFPTEQYATQHSMDGAGLCCVVLTAGSASCVH